MNLPLWIWPALCVVCLLLLSEYECRQINRKRDALRDSPAWSRHIYDREQDAA